MSHAAVGPRTASPPPVAKPRWRPGDAVCVAVGERKNQVTVRHGEVVFASTAFVVVAFEHYRVSYDPQRIWAADESPPPWIEQIASAAEELRQPDDEEEEP